MSGGAQYIECYACGKHYLRGSGNAFCPHKDAVNQPSHYTFGKFEVIDVLEDWFDSDPLLWQVGKYIARAGRKAGMLEDLRKAKWYLERRIGQLERLQGQQKGGSYERKDLGQFTGIITDAERLHQLDEECGFAGSADEQSNDRRSAASERQPRVCGIGGAPDIHRCNRRVD